MTSYSYNEYPYDGQETEFDLNFTLGYINQSHVLAEIIRGSADPVSVPFDFVTDTRIRITGYLEEGDIVRIRRIVPKSQLVSNLTNAGEATRENLYNAVLQSIMIAHEYLDGFGQDIAIGPQLTDSITTGLTFIANNYDAMINIGAFSPSDVQSLGDFVASIAAAQATADEAWSGLFSATQTQLPAGKEFIFTGSSTTGNISRILQLRANNVTDRPSICWLDYTGNLRAAIGYHDLLFTDDNTVIAHYALEFKTSSENDGMSTRISVETGADAVPVDFNNISQFQMLRHDAAATSSSERVVARFNMDATMPTLDINPNVHTSGSINFSGNRAVVEYNGSDFMHLRAGPGKGMKFFTGFDADTGDYVTDWSLIIDSNGRIRVNNAFRPMQVSRQWIQDNSSFHVVDDVYMLNNAAEEDIVSRAPVVLATGGNARCLIQYTDAGFIYV